MRLLLLGATGVVGREVLAQALADARVETLVAPTRRPLAATDPKLTAPLVRFDDLPADADWWRADAVICTLGTTIKKAGSRENFRRVDHDYALAVARLARAHGTPAFAIVSARGANPRSALFYFKVKGETEADLATLGFASLTLARPGLIGGEREDMRRREQIGAAILKLLGPLLPTALRINPSPRIAKALLDAAIEGRAGTRVIDSAEMS